MFNILRNLGAPVLSAADRFIRDQVAAGIRRTGSSALKAARRNPDTSNLKRNLIATQVTLNTPVVRAGVAAFGGGAGIGAANATGFTGQIERALNQVGPNVDRFLGAVTPQAIQKFGREQENKTLIQALDPTFGLLSSVFPGTNLPRPQPPMPGLPEGYKEQELIQRAAAERYRASKEQGLVQDVARDPVDFSGQQAAADRAYRQELSRISQITAQNPELKRYEADRVKAKTQEERNAVRDMGLAMWQKEYGQKQIGKPGGAIGTFNPLMSTGNATQTTGNQLVVPINTDEAPYHVGDFSRATLNSGYDLNALGITPETIVELQNRLLLQSIK